MAVIARTRHLEAVQRLLARYPVVVILGARQVGKTTLARQLMAVMRTPSAVFDLENPADLAQLADPMLALQATLMLPSVFLGIHRIPAAVKDVAHS